MGFVGSGMSGKFGSGMDDTGKYGNFSYENGRYGKVRVIFRSGVAGTGTPGISLPWQHYHCSIRRYDDCN